MVKNPLLAQHTTAEVREPQPGRKAAEGSPFITLRALVLGALTIVAMFYWMDINVKSQFPMVAFSPFVLWLFLNVGLKRLFPQRALRRGELLTIFSMTWVVGTMPREGWIHDWASVVAAPSHFATAENQWDEIFFDLLPWHVFARTSPQVIDGFWFGAEAGTPVPWMDWLGVIGQWLGVSLGLVVFGFCLFVLFQRQWVEVEKLTFPLAQLPLDLTRGFDGPRRMPEIFSSPLFWLGVGVVLLPTLYNIATYFAPGLPPLDVFWQRHILTSRGPLSRDIGVRVMPIVLAVAYLCPLDILGSLIVFYWLAVLKDWALLRVGFSAGMAGQQIEGREILFMESYGALIFLALWSIWLARGHLRQVWQQVRSGEGDRRQVVRYRFALVGLVLSAAYVIHWVVGLGMSLPLAVGAFLLMTLVYFVTVKLMAATGFAYLFPDFSHMKGETFIVDLVGSIHLAPRSLIAFKLFTSRAFFGTIRMPAWPAMAHHLRIFSLREQPGWVTAAVVVAFPVGFLVAVGAIVERGYEEGALVFVIVDSRVFDEMVLAMHNHTVADWGKWCIWLFGFFEAATMALLRAHFHWFPFHPVGLAFQYTIGTFVYWFSLLLVWLVKWTLLRYGAVQAFLRGKSFFYGLAIGYVLGIVLSMWVDMIWFPVKGHGLHRW